MLTANSGLRLLFSVPVDEQCLPIVLEQFGQSLGYLLLCLLFQSRAFCGGVRGVEQVLFDGFAVCVGDAIER